MDDDDDDDDDDEEEEEEEDQDDDWWWLILVKSEGSCTWVFLDTLTCRLSFIITKDLMFLRRAPPPK